MIDKILPLVTLEKVEHAEIVGKLLKKNGFNSAEVTYRTECATEVIKLMAKIEDFTVGAGTITSVEQMIEAKEAGAKFIITPGINIPVLEEAKKRNIEIYPGVITPSEIEICRSYNIKTVKLFPCGIFGGINLLKAYRGPFFDFKFIPTGGVNENNAREFLEMKNVKSVGGSFIIKDEFIKEEQWDCLDKHLNKIRIKLKEYF